MTEPEKPPTPTTKEVQKVGRYLTLQNVVQLLIVVGFITGFYYKTSFRLDAAEEAQKKTNQILQFQQDWLTGLSIKTGVAPPARREN